MNSHIFCRIIFLQHNSIDIVIKKFIHCVFFCYSLLLKFLFYFFLYCLLFLTLLIDFFYFKSRFVNFYDTNQSKKLYDSDGPYGCSGSFWLCCNLTETVVIGGAWGINNIGEHRDIEKERNWTNAIKPEEKTEEIVFDNKTAKNDFDGENDDKNNIENIEIDIVRFLSSYDSDIVTDKRVDCKESDNDLQRNTWSILKDYLISTFLIAWLKLFGRWSRFMDSGFPLVKKLSPLPGFWIQTIGTSRR